MDYGAWVPYGLAIDAASGVLFVALGLAVAWLARGAPRENRRLVWSFVAFAIVWGANLFSRNVAREEIGGPFPLASEANLVTTFLQLVTTGWFALAFPRALRADERRLVVLPLVAALLAGASQLLYGPITPPGSGLLLVFAMEVLCFTFLLLLLVGRFASARGRDDERVRRDARVATVAFVPYWAAGSGAVAVVGAPYGVGVQVASAAGLATTYLIGALWLRAGERRLAFALFAGPIVGAALAVATDPEFVLDLGFMGVLRLFAVLVLSYAILRHQLLGLDVKVRWTLEKSTVAAIFLVVFFVASEGAQAMLSDRWGTAIGIGTAAALLFALAPIQHFAERLATAAVPSDGARPASGGLAEREDSYRFALRQALADGDLTREEERSLAKLATQLGIEAARAFELREQVDGEQPTRATRRARR